MLIAGVISAAFGGLCPRRARMRAGLTLAGLCVAAWLTFSLYPQMIAARDTGQMRVFDTLHHTYTRAFSVQLLLLLGVAVLTALLHLGKPGSTRANEAR
jgi:hypothetical protein